MLALPALAFVRGARVPVVGARDTVVLGVCLVHTAFGRVARVRGARVPVVAIGRRSAHAFFLTAFVRGGALVAIIAWIFVAREEAPAGRVALVIRASVVIVTEFQSTAHALARRAFVHRGAGVAIIAGRAFQLVVLARAVRIAGVRGAWVAIIAEAFVRLSVAVVIQTVAYLRLGWNTAGREPVRGAHASSFAGAGGRRVVARGGRLELFRASVTVTEYVSLERALIDRDIVHGKLFALVVCGAIRVQRAPHTAELAFRTVIQALVQNAAVIAVRVLNAWIAQSCESREAQIYRVSPCSRYLVATVSFWAV